VIPDFSLRGVETPIAATVYTPSATGTYDFVTVRLVGTHIPETLTSIDGVWHAIQGPASVDRFFLDDHIQRIYLGVLRQAQAFGFFAMMAALLACRGLVGLSASITDRRTREIGVRKAMGGRHIGDRSPAALGVQQAGAVGQSDCVACGGIRDAWLAQRVRVSH
jgi:putative ABC transport system permease protein